jgi:hypothetical protein
MATPDQTAYLELWVQLECKDHKAYQAILETWGRGANPADQATRDQQVLLDQRAGLVMPVLQEDQDPKASQAYLVNQETQGKMVN